MKTLVSVLRRFKRAIGCSITDIIGISSGICTHKIQLEPKCIPCIEHKHRINPLIQELVNTEIIKWLNENIFYPISDIKLVSPVQSVPKKGGITVVSNAKNKLIT